MQSPKKEKEFLQIYDSHAEAIYRHCYFRVYDSERARDLMQESYTKAWQYLSEGNEVENLKALIYKIANNLIIDFVRKKKEASLEVLQEQGFEPSEDKEEHLHARLDGAVVLAKLELLEEEYRQAVYMRYVDDLKPKEIAAALGLSVNVVSVRIHRGSEKLRKLLKA